MIKFIIKKFIANYENVKDADVRKAYGVLSGTIGLLCNLLLFLIKFVTGLFANSIAIMSDAFNNLTDSGSSLITLLGAKLSNKPPDKEHPHGHGRYEYIATLIVAFLIFGVGWELLGSSIEKIINPVEVTINYLTLFILCFSILIKLWMYSYNRYIGKTIDSSMNIATAKDSLNDSLATTGILIGTIVGLYVDLPIDGILGVAISLLIMYTGFTVAKDAVNSLLGQSPDAELLEQIYEIVSKSEPIKNGHDLRIHDYGPGWKVASMHVMVPSDMVVSDAHNLIHELEQKIKKELGVDIVIHMDPDNLKDEWD